MHNAPLRSTDITFLVANTWDVDWCCNVQKNNKFWILDSKNGLVMALMKNVHKWGPYTTLGEWPNLKVAFNIICD
jgi:hypothetical protein